MKRPERPGAQPTPPPARGPAAGVRPSPALRTPRGAVPRERPAVREPRRETPPRAERSVTTRSERRADRVRRRYEKAEVRRFTRAARRRRMGWLVVLTVLGGVAALIAIAVFSPILALREVRVDGTDRLDAQQIVDAVSGQEGTPLALLDEGRLRDDLSQFTLIRSYVTELVPPGTLVIHIVERTPLGVVATSSGFDLLDAAGVLLESSPTRPEGLPLLEVDADGVEGAGFAAMAEVLIALPPDVLARVDSISARTRDDVTLRLSGSAQRVVWGSAEDSQRKADILTALLDRYAGRGPGEYDVSAPGSAVFRED